MYEFGVNVRALISGGGRVGGDVLGEEEEVVVVGVEGARAGVQLGRLGDLEEDVRGREHVLVEVGEDDLLDRGWKWRTMKVSDGKYELGAFQPSRSRLCVGSVMNRSAPLSEKRLSFLMPHYARWCILISVYETEKMFVVIDETFRLLKWGIEVPQHMSYRLTFNLNRDILAQNRCVR